MTMFVTWPCAATDATEASAAMIRDVLRMPMVS